MTDYEDRGPLTLDENRFDVDDPVQLQLLVPQAQWSKYLQSVDDVSWPSTFITAFVVLPTSSAKPTRRGSADSIPVTIGTIPAAALARQEEATLRFPRNS